MKKMSRRAFIPALGAVCVSATFPFAGEDETVSETTFLQAIKPKRLLAGNTIAIAAPAGPLRDISHADIFKKKLESLGFKVVMGKNVKQKYGFFTATDEERAAELMAFFEDKNIDGIVCMKGGWGCARILDLLNYQIIRENPKVLMGFSDITSLLNAIRVKSGLITFHGPGGNSTWNDFSLDYIKKALVYGDKIHYGNGPEKEDEVNVIVKGNVTGELFGGNLSVFTAMIGTEYLPDFHNKILFLEEVDEEPFRVDRMLTQIDMAGITEKVSGIILGKFRDCVAEEPDFAFTVEEIFAQHYAQLKIPVISNVMIGHIRNKFTVPVGLTAQLNADQSYFKLLESAVI